MRSIQANDLRTQQLMRLHKKDQLIKALHFIEDLSLRIVSGVLRVSSGSAFILRTFSSLKPPQAILGSLNTTKDTLPKSISRMA